MLRDDAGTANLSPRNLDRAIIETCAIDTKCMGSVFRSMFDVVGLLADERGVGAPRQVLSARRRSVFVKVGQMPRRQLLCGPASRARSCEASTAGHRERELG